MVHLKTRQKITNSKQFARQLVNDSYTLRQSERLNTCLVYSSEWSNPTLYRVKNYHFKMFYLINQLQREMSKLGVNIAPGKIKEDTLKKEVVIYQKMLLDRQTGKLVDYYFVLDSKMAKVMIFRRETDFAQEQGRVYRAIRYLHDEMFMDFDQIHRVLSRNGFEVNSRFVSHIVSELH